MKNLSLIIAIATALGIAYFIYLNLGYSTIVMCPLQNKNFEISLAQLIALIFMAGAVAGLTFTAFNYSSKIDALNAYKRKHEKMSVQSDSDEGKIKALEAKIQTLETALKSALENN